MTKQEILTLVEKVHGLKKDKSNALPDNTFILEEDTVLTYPRKYGDSRYPYYNGGLTLFPHTTGYIDVTKGPFTVFPAVDFAQDAPVAFFAGEKKEDGTYFPISVTGAARQAIEPGVERYVIFTPVCAYYIVETEKAIFAVRAHMDKDDHIRFSVSAINRGEERTVYLCSFFEPTLKYGAFEYRYHRMWKYGLHQDNGNFLMMTHNEKYDCLAINEKVEGNVVEKQFTTAKRTFLGLRGGCLTNSLALVNGRYDEQVAATNTTDQPIASDMIHFRLGQDDFACIHYDMLWTVDKAEAEAFLDTEMDMDKENAALADRKEEERKVFENLDISFKDWYNDEVHPKVFNQFVKFVQRQVTLCSLGDRYAGESLGIRDVFQQLEPCLLWNKDRARWQIVRVMNYMLDTGRPPRQITFPSQDHPIPNFDMRPFIDQGFWIFSTLHTYLAYTDDFSILGEICGYYKPVATYGPITTSDEKDSVLCHLERIMDFLISCVDEKTHCVRILHGDWNDALVGMGDSSDPEKEFGDGVSVMATLQMYLSLAQMCDILEHVGGKEQRIQQLKELQEQIAVGFMQYAVETDNEGVKRVLHGWGENRSYFVGSTHDYDGKDRKSLTTQAYFAISDMVRRYPELKEDIVKNILSLDSKYGLLTFDKSFDEYSPKVGELSTIAPGTVENACAYVHASTFAIMGLFQMGYSKEAWEQFQKSIIITHDNATLTSFVMANSYCENASLGMDGESLGDWYTGSGAVVIKELVRCGFGVVPNMDSVILMPPKFMPCKQAEMTLNIKGADVCVRYDNKGEGKRRITLNGVDLPLTYDEISDTFVAEISREQLGKKAEIEIID
jgi:cellobiose phosphorylase